MSHSDPKTLHHILSGVARGDERSFEMLYKMFSNRVCFLSRKYFLSDEEAEEVVQEVFLKVWKHRRQIDSEKSFPAYIKKITNNSLSNRLQRKVVERKFQQPLLAQQPVGLNATQQAVEFQELQQNLERSISSLPPKRKEIFRLSREKGLSSKEISAKLGISKRTVDDHLTKSLQFLRKRLDIVASSGKTAIILLLVLLR